MNYLKDSALHTPLFLLSSIISFISSNFFHNKIQAQVNHVSIIPYVQHLGNQKPVSKRAHSNLLLHSLICTFMEKPYCLL